MIILNLLEFTQINTSKVCFVIRYANYIKYEPNNLPLWQSVTKPQEYIECPRIHSTQDYKKISLV